jgi:multiple sugar transport system permease protein
MILIVIIVLYPVLYGIQLSFTSQVPGTSEFRYVGLANYESILNSRAFRQSLQVTLIFSVGYVTITMLLALLLATLLNLRVKFSSVYMTVLFIPWVLSPTAAAIIWRWLFNPTLGLIELGLQDLGLVGIGGVLSNPAGARAIMIGLSVWQMLPFATLLLLAGLQGISKELVEASRIDGANLWQSFTKIILPLLRPQVLVLLLLLSIGAVNSSDVFIVVTDGGPGNATEVLGIHMYHIAFRFFQLSQGSALAMIMFLINLVMVVVYFRVLRPDTQT